jgi:hypothetical protein
MVGARGRRDAIVNAAFAKANVGNNVGFAGVGGAAVPPGLPPLPNVIAVQPPRLPPLTPLEEAFTEIGFSADASRILTSPNNQNITLPSLALMDDAEVKTLCATMRKPGGGKQGTNVATRAEVLLKNGVLHGQSLSSYITSHGSRGPKVQQHRYLLEPLQGQS